MLVAEAAETQAWAVSAPRQGKAIQVLTVTHKEKQAALLLTPRSELGSVKTPWAPNVFRGTGQEECQTITYEITQELYEQIQRLESAVLEKAREVVPNADALWHSAIRSVGSHPATLKTKIFMSGSRRCRFVDENDQPIDPPTEWRGRPVLPLVAVRGLYLQKTMVGLMLDTAALMVGAGAAQEPEYEFGH